MADVEPERFLPWHVHDKRRIQRWRNCNDLPALQWALTLGDLPDGRWWVESTREPCGWIWPDEASARADCERRMAGDDRWVEIPAVATPPRRTGGGGFQVSGG